jgi:TetR/AcrR family transcriptional regulator
MSDADLNPSAGSSDAAATPARKRPKPGERRIQILQALASMLEQPGAERITTAALAAKLEVSEAALYRHFASKAQMFEGLIEFIEQAVFTLVNQIAEREAGATDPSAGTRHAGKVVTMLLQFAEKNPGMVRVMVGDALVYENERLQQRMNQFFDKIEVHPQAVPARRGRLRCRHAHGRRPGPGLGAHGLRGGPPAALCALGFPPGPHRALGRQPRADAALITSRSG